MVRHSMRLSARAAFATVAFIGALSPVTSLKAQARPPIGATLVGMVKDSAGTPVSGVQVWLRGTDFYVSTNTEGGFRLPGLPVGPARISLRRLGFEPATVDLELREGRIDSLVISLTSVAANLPEVKIEEENRVKRMLAGFYDRRSKGFGTFFTREEIEARHPIDFTDIVRTTPGVSIQMIGGRRQVRMSRSALNPRGDCPPQYFVDGMRVENASADEFVPHDIDGIEIYSGPATIPSQFAPRAVQIQKTCGVIVIWTRVPGT